MKDEGFRTNLVWRCAPVSTPFRNCSSVSSAYKFYSMTCGGQPMCESALLFSQTSPTDSVGMEGLVDLGEYRYGIRSLVHAIVHYLPRDTITPFPLYQVPLNTSTQTLMDVSLCFTSSLCLLPINRTRSKGRLIWASLDPRFGDRTMLR